MIKLNEKKILICLKIILLSINFLNENLILTYNGFHFDVIKLEELAGLRVGLRWADIYTGFLCVDLSVTSLSRWTTEHGTPVAHPLTSLHCSDHHR